MPNWCDNDVTFYGPYDQVEDLCKSINRAFAESTTTTAFGSRWLGNIVIYFGEDPANVSCRGQAYDDAEIVELPNSMCGVHLLCDSAWGPADNLFDFLTSFYPDVKYVYVAEEPGMEFYENTDSSREIYPQEYKLECFSGSMDYFESFEELAARLGEITKCPPPENLEKAYELIEKYNDALPRNSDDGLSLHQFS